MSGSPHAQAATDRDEGPALVAEGSDARAKRMRLWPARAAVAELFFMNGALFGAWVSRLPAVVQAREFSHAALGLHLLCVAIGAVLTIPLAGLAIARFGSANLSRVAGLAFCGILPLLASVPNGVAFVAALLLTGITAGALDVSMNSQAVEVERRYRQPIMSSFHGFFSVGGLVGAAAGGLFAERCFSLLRHFAWMSVVFTAFTLLAVTQLVHEPRSRVTPAAGASATPARKFELDRLTLRLGALGLLAMVAEGAMADWSAVYLRRELRASEAIAASGYAAFSVTMAVGRFAGDAVTRRFGPVRIIQASGALAFISLLAVLGLPWPHGALIGFAGVGAGLSIVVPLVFSAAGALPGRAPGVALATVTTFAYLGFLAGPPTIGFLAQVFGLRLALGAIVLACAFIVRLSRSVSPAKLPAGSAHS